jgi:hypothetical protein
MNSSANVQSFDAVIAVRASLVAFGDQVEQALSMVDLEMRRLLDWLEHDRPRFWRTQLRMARDEVTAARAALHRCLMYPIGDERPSCREEKATLKLAEARLRYCEEKAERLKHWTREIRHEMFEYDGRIRQLTELVEYDAPLAIGILTKLLTHLEEYRAIQRDGGRVESISTAALADALWPADKEKRKVPEQ